MKTFLDCIPCLVNQALRAGRHAVDDENTIKEILNQAGAIIKDIPMESTPVETGAVIYKIVRDVTGVDDPYKKIKDKNIREALDLIPHLEKILSKSEDPLLTAIRIAIAGNVIDLGVDKKFNIVEDMEKILNQDFAIFHYNAFKERLSSAKKILYIGDNSGESVFDTLLIKNLNANVFYAVRGIPVINDVTFNDAVNSGIDKVASIISSEVDSPGAIVKNAGREFQKLFNEADLVISKGQGNYEGLSQEKRDIFFLLKAKCHVIANDAGVAEDSIILKGINI